MTEAHAGKHWGLDRNRVVHLAQVDRVGVAARACAQLKCTAHTLAQI